MIPFHVMLAALFGWLEREERDVSDFCARKTARRKSQLGSGRLWLTDD